MTRLTYSTLSSSQTNDSQLCFHTHHGVNIELRADRTVAHRRSSFANSIVFSERPLRPNEVLLLEIDRNENGWSGHMRLGLTQVDPNLQPPLPMYALPDLNLIGRSWVFAITRSNNWVYDGINGEMALPGTEHAAPPGPELPSVAHPTAILEMFNIRFLEETADDDVVSTSVQRISNNGFFSIGDDGTYPLPTDVGSRIGVYYRVTGESSAQMHLIINGIDQGPSAFNIPLSESPLYAVVDVYGTTKQVRIVPVVRTVPPLQELCRMTILKNIDSRSIDLLPLPEKLKVFITNTNCCSSSKNG